MSEEIKTYKAFDKDLKCRDMQYHLESDHYHEGEVIPCESGLHACENPLHLFRYYSPANSRFAETVSHGVTKRHDEDSKIASSKLKVKGEKQDLSWHSEGNG